MWLSEARGRTPARRQAAREAAFRPPSQQPGRERGRGPASCLEAKRRLPVRRRPLCKTSPGSSERSSAFARSRATSMRLCSTSGASVLSVPGLIMACPCTRHQRSPAMPQSKQCTRGGTDRCECTSRGLQAPYPPTRARSCVRGSEHAPSQTAIPLENDSRGRHLYTARGRDEMTCGTDLGCETRGLGRDLHS